jgi:ComF family protein
MFGELLHFLFPETCVCCENVLEEKEAHICTICLQQLPILESDDVATFHKLAGRVNLYKAHSFLKFNKSGKAQKIIHQIKYMGNASLGIFVGKLFSQYMTENGIDLDFDCLIPVPLHPKRLQSRGYNQAESIAKGFAESKGIFLDNSLLKTKEALSQTRKSRASRLENMKDCFDIATSHALQNKHIAIIDDVITTGATLEACCLCLEKAGVKKITVLSLAVA